MSMLVTVMRDHSHPGSDIEWRLTDGCLTSFAEQVVDMPVTVGYDPERVIGRVVSTDRIEGQLQLTINLEPEVDLEEAGNAYYGPLFATPRVEDGVVDEARLLQVSMWKED